MHGARLVQLPERRGALRAQERAQKLDGQDNLGVRERCEVASSLQPPSLRGALGSALARQPDGAMPFRKPPAIPLHRPALTQLWFEALVEQAE